MKRFLLAGILLGVGGAPVIAADIPVKAPRPAAAGFNWTGCHVGAVFGVMRGESKQEYGGLVNGVPNAFLPVGADMTGTYEVSGALAGGTVGCDYQVNRWVIGIEGDAAWTGAKGRTPPDAGAIALGLNSNFEFTTEQRWMATLRGRIGMLWGDRQLLYVTGGAAWGGFDLNNQNSLLTATTARQAPESVDKLGWIFGGGTEVALQPNWTFKAELLYADYGTMHYGDAPGTVTGCTAGCANADVSMRAWIIRGGLNYKF